MNGASVMIAALTAALVLIRLLGSLHADDAAAAMVALPLGLFVADVVSALAHWFADTYFDADSPVLGAIIGPFRLHHDDPRAFRRHDFCERNRNNCLVALPLLGLAYWLSPWATEMGNPVVGATVTVTAITLASATQIHAWAHEGDVPRVIAWLQHSGILLSRERHARHHLGAHDRAYGIVNGWANAALDRTQLFRRTEALVARLGLYAASLESARGSRTR
jgi:plasmanylethanolamine desaturase